MSLLYLGYFITPEFGPSPHNEILNKLSCHRATRARCTSCYWGMRRLSPYYYSIVTCWSYLAESLHRTSDVDTRRRLRSADSAMLVVPSTRRSTLGDRAFPVASARAWNSLPSSVRNAPSLTTFRRELKTVLFRSSFDND